MRRVLCAGAGVRRRVHRIARQGFDSSGGSGLYDRARLSCAWLGGPGGTD